jgi:mono/diheme cytochrome c family protein
LLKELVTESNNIMKKWLLFFFLILAAVVLCLYLFYFKQSETYRPDMSDPALIFSEACVPCHGETGEGKGFFFPDSLDSSLSRRDVIEAVREGKLFMPAFPNIPDSTLNKLARYIARKGYNNP